MLLTSTGSDNTQTHRHAHGIVKSLIAIFTAMPRPRLRFRRWPACQPASQLFAPSEPGPRDLGYTRASPGRAHDSRLDLSSNLTRVPSPLHLKAYKLAS